MRTVETDVAIIGAGSAGLSAYRAVKAAGKRAVLIEGGQYGTTCARVGCMPSKLLIAPAEAVHNLDKFGEFGLALDGKVVIDGRKVMDRVKRERDRFVGFVLDDVEHLPSDDKLRGCARFVDDKTLAVGDDVTVKARAIVIATGSVVSYPAAWKALGDRLITSDDIFYFDDLPKSVAVFGPGVIGLELGQALHRLGVRVKIYGRGGTIATLADPDLLANARAVFCGELDLDTNARAEVSLDGGEVRVEYRDGEGVARSERFEYLLAATGRASNVHHLDLEKTSLQRNHQGAPCFDRSTMRCGTSNIFIAGDATGDLPLLHEASDEGRIAGSNAARYPDVAPRRRSAELAVVFTDPQIAVVGGGYKSAQHLAHVVGEVSFKNQGRSRIMQRNQGMLHVYAEISSGRLLGAEMIGPDAEHIGHLLAWTLQMKLTIAQLLEMPFYHPVVEEGLRTALRDARDKLSQAQAAMDSTSALQL